MTQRFAEILLLVPAALATGFVLFIPSVVQKIMDDMNETEFKRFLTLLTAHAFRSPYAIVVSSITFLGMFPYWYFYGFGNRWFSAGLMLWVVASIVSKYTTLPIYARVTGRKFPGYKQLPEVTSDDAAGLCAERAKLSRANVLRAALCAASVVLMVVGLF